MTHSLLQRGRTPPLPERGCRNGPEEWEKIAWLFVILPRPSATPSCKEGELPPLPDTPTGEMVMKEGFLKAFFALRRPAQWVKCL